MAEITPNMIKELRERTGVGMGKCKEALEQAKGDINLAIENLRKSGMATAVKKEGRETKEGTIAIAENNNRIAVVEVNAETDFVVRNDNFKVFVDTIAHEVLNSNPSSLDTFLKQPFSKDKNLTIDQYRATIIQKIGENIVIKRIKLFDKTPNHSYGIYSHLGGKIVVIVDLEGSNEDSPLAKDIAMHTAAASPDYLSPDQVPADVIAREREIAKAQIQGKPANIVEKIVDGKMNAFYDACCLLKQKFVRNDQLSISELIQQKSKERGKELKLLSFTRWNVGQ